MMTIIISVVIRVCIVFVLVLLLLLLLSLFFIISHCRFYFHGIRIQAPEDLLEDYELQGYEEASPRRSLLIALTK